MAINPLSIFAGPSPLPPQAGTVTNVNAPAEWSQGQTDIAMGAGLTQQGQALAAGGASAMTQGQSALAQAQAGILTPEQQAQLNIYSTGLKNTAMQTYESMGINPNKSTSFISTEEDIAQKTIAMGQSFIQSTIQLAMADFAAGGTLFSAGAGFTSAGASFTGLGQQAEDASTKDLLATAQMQISQDQAYSKLIGDTIGSIAKMAAAVGTGGASTAISGLTNFVGGAGGTSPGLGQYEGKIDSPANTGA